MKFHACDSISITKRNIIFLLVVKQLIQNIWKMIILKYINISEVKKNVYFISKVYQIKQFGYVQFNLIHNNENTVIT